MVGLTTNPTGYLHRVGYWIAPNHPKELQMEDGQQDSAGGVRSGAHSSKV